MTTILIWLFYLVGFISLTALLLIIVWWTRWIILVAYALVPTMAIIYTIYAILFALPINILFDGSPFEQQVVKFSHLFSESLWNIFVFACTAPFLAIGLIIDILHWCTH